MKPLTDSVSTIVLVMLENRSFDHMLGSLKALDPRINGLTGNETNLDITNEPAKVQPLAEFQGQLDPDPNHHFPAVNKQLFFGQYKRIASYFEGTELAATGLPSGRELELLETVRGKVPAELFTKVYSNPVCGNPAAIRQGFEMLRPGGRASLLGIPNQPVELDLRAYAGKVPIELLGRIPFPPIGELPYFVTLAPYGFYWFQLVAA